MELKPCLVDGTYELFRAYYGAPSRVATNGSEIGAAVALGRSLASLAEKGTFSHFAVAFDTVIESFRNDLFAGYKTGEGIDPQLLSQFDLAERVTSALGFTVLSMIEFEADDGLASAARLFAERDDVQLVTIASPDKDLMQLVDARTVTWDRMRQKLYDTDAVVAKMGVLPESIPDYLALVGDSADGIPGVPRWGARSAASVLGRYRHLEEIPLDASKWAVQVRGAAALVQQLAERFEEALLYRRLATLRSDVDLGRSVDDFAYRGPDAARLAALRDELGDSGLG